MDYKKDIGLLYENILINEVAGAINYWITPDGELERVYNHMDYADENIDLEDLEDQGQTMDEIYDQAYKLGYIRIVENPSNIYFSYNISIRPSKKQFVVMFNLANDKRKNLVDGETQKVIVQNNAESSDSLGKNEQLTKMDQDLQLSFYKNRGKYGESYEKKFPLKDYTKLIYENC